jgi:glutathione S-transferase
MRLFYSDASPFARKCRIVVREKGLLPQVREVAADVMADEPELLAANPLGQIPALLLDDGRWLSDSPLICAFLDHLGGEPRLVPEPTGIEPEGHWGVRWRETLADGALEMAVKLVVENRRPEAERSALWIARWTAGLHRSLDRIEAEAVLDSGTLDLGAIALGVLGPYLDFRHPALRWREAHPRLASLCDRLGKRPSFLETRPA